MTEDVQAALTTDRTIDITTIGRKTGEPRRLEIWFHNIDGRIFITGMPGIRSWYANLVANPDFTFHLKESVEADLPASARAVTDLDEKRSVLDVLLARLGYSDRIEAWLAGSPLVEVSFS